ncbi:hypothetical protein PVAP13_5NG633950 [Panicum virgatum]|uniref:Uncharacterized protein n=1 Tax=Panicum virgatum TaxID=38727 RepID=A0A8T0S5E2_PANVG|nr:hypothetical protein PVAP13_5NG633950 [Panicum virgatum]
MRDAAGPIPSTTTYNRGRRPITSDHGGPTHVTSTTLAAARNATTPRDPCMVQSTPSSTTARRLIVFSGTARTRPLRHYALPRPNAGSKLKEATTPSPRPDRSRRSRRPSGRRAGEAHENPPAGLASILHDTSAAARLRATEHGGRKLKRGQS